MPANHIKGRLFINHTSEQGFSESYRFPTTNYAQARDWMKEVLDYRSLLLGLNTSIVHHSLSLVDSDHDSDMVPSHLSDPAELDTETGTGVLPINRLKEGIKTRFFTADGKSTTFLYRAIRDDWTEDMLLTITPGSSILPVSWTPAAAGFTAASAIAHFMSVVFNRTNHVKKTGPGTYVLTAWSAYQVKGIGERDCGKGYSFTRGRKKQTI